MAKMYPSFPDDDTPRSERKVFENLRENLSDRYLVMHSQRFFRSAVSSRRAEEKEADFVVLDPTRGYLVLEVKGGGVQRKAGNWSTINRKTGETHSIKDPGKQAQDGAHAIRRNLKQRPWFGRNGQIPDSGWGVILPDVTVQSGLGSDLPRELIIDQRDLEDISASLDRIFDAHNLGQHGVLSDARREFLDALAPEFHLVPTLAARIEEDYPSLVRLTNEQFEIMDGYAEMKRVCVSGTAGTGKTLLAMERARRLADQGKRVILIVFTKALAELLAKRASGFSVISYHRMCSKLVRKAGNSFNVPQDRNQQGKFWLEGAPELLLSALDILPDERWDAVIVDEGQDFKELWWITIEKLLADPDDSIFWVFSDSKQNIYRGSISESLQLSPARLTYNCRNTSKIAKYSSDFMGIEVKVKPHAPEGTNVEQIECKNEKDEVRKLLHKLVNEEGINPDQIVILSARNLSKSRLWTDGKLGNFKLVEFPTSPGPNEIQFSTLEKFKGWEADVVILCELDIFSQKRKSYIATSRARHVLKVLVHKHVLSPNFTKSISDNKRLGGDLDDEIPF